MSRDNYAKQLENKNVLVVGMGKSGRASVRVLLDCGARVSVQDSADASSIDRELLDWLEEAGVQQFFGCTPESMTDYDMLVLSPGVPPQLEFIQAASAAGAEIIGELELAYRITPAHFVAITGTNGKTTTTTLVGEIFRASGRKTAVVGNIGEPVVTEAETADEHEWLITETSSFQLETTRDFRPVVSAILNLTPDHLNRHKTMEAYGDAKARVAINQSQEEYLVVNYDDASVMKLAEQSHAAIIPFSRRTSLATGACLDGTMMVVRDEQGTEHRICDTGDLKIIGDHNIENALAAAAISFFAGIDAGTIGNAIKAFPGVEHRIEFCGRKDGVDYYNDSKGTNVDAAVIAIKALRDKIILIAGGDGKAQDFTELAEHLEGAVEVLVLLGRDAPLIEEAARKTGYTEIYNCADMEECVQRASELARDGDKVLLSPACASWDMYPSYEVRGRHFKQCVSDIIG